MGKSGRKRSTPADMTARKASQAKGGGAVAGVLHAAFHNNDLMARRLDGVLAWARARVARRAGVTRRQGVEQER
jgi:hypothetical protein